MLVRHMANKHTPFHQLLDEIVSELNIIQAICGSRLGTSSQLEDPSVFLLVPTEGGSKA